MTTLFPTLDAERAEALLRVNLILIRRHPE